MYIGTIDDDVLVQLVDSVNAMIEGTYVCTIVHMGICVLCVLCYKEIYNSTKILYLIVARDQHENMVSKF